ncbi:hypothetical protein THER_1822 [Thermodesulfovibrio sp. N1]|nr:hypothetical protein THER_1822 [Thermodesulfovibrio sp. N1]
MPRGMSHYSLDMEKKEEILQSLMLPQNDPHIVTLRRSRRGSSFSITGFEQS